jgi:DNA-binding SARP family transcriptional activator
MQPRRLALLAYLAVVDGGRPHRRDIITAMFWPESDTRRSRHALRQTIYALRRDGGDGLLVGRGQEEIGLGPDALTCDAVEFTALLDSGHLEQALSLYQGDFLAGLHASGAADEFEDWLTGSRNRFRARAVTAATALARRAEEARKLDAAAHWLGVAVGVDPLHEASHRALIRVLLAAGNSGGARAAYQTLEARLRRDLDSEPSADTRALLDQIARPPVTVGVATIAPEPDSLPDHSATGATVVAPADQSPLPARRSALSRRILIGVALVLAAAAFLISRWWRPPDTPPLIAVAGFEWSGTGDSGTSAIMADLLSNGLARLPGVQILSGPRVLELEERLSQLPSSVRALRAATAAGATLLVRGQLSGAEGARRVDLQVIELSSGRIRHTARASAPDLLGLADSAANELATYFRVPPPERSASAGRTRSLVAYRFYEEGLRSYYAGDGSAALQLFQEALAEDSNFAMAAYYGAEAARVQGEGELMARLQDRIRRLAPTLPDRERLLLRTAVAMADVDPASTVLADSLVERWPADPDAELMRARAYSIFGRNQDEAIRSARQVILLDSINLRHPVVPCRACEAYLQLALSLIYQNDFTGAERTAREFIAVRPDQAGGHGMLDGILSRLGRTAESAREAAISDSLTGRYPRLEMDALLRAGEFAAADAELERWVRSTTPSVRADGRWWLTISLRTQGQMAAALRLQRENLTPGSASMASDSDPTLIAQILCESGSPGQGAMRFARLAAPPGSATHIAPFHSARNTSWMLTQAATCRALAGDTTSLARLADSIETIGAITGSPRHRALHHYVRGLLWRARGDWSAALAEQRQAMTSPVEGSTRINYEMAGALLRLGRVQEAIPPLQAALRAPLQASGLYLTRTEVEDRLAQAFDATGQRDSAQVHYAWVAQAWGKADPPFRSRYDIARRRAGITEH